MSSRHIRLATTSETDYAARFAVLSACDPATTLEKLKFSDDDWDAKYRRKTFILEMNSDALAVGVYEEWIWWYEPGRYYMHISVHPAFRRQGHGSALYDTMREHLANETPPGRLLMCKCRDNEPESLHFILQRGFHQTGADQYSELDVTAFDEAQFVPLLTRLHEQGIQLISYPQLVVDDPAFYRKFYDLRCLTMQDMPAGGTRTYPPFEQLIQSVFQYPGFLPENFYVAVENGRYVGQSDLIGEPTERQHLNTGYTGVHPDYRRRGIATALKVRCIQAAKEQGVVSIATDNWHTNPMYQLNLQLGFKPSFAELWFELGV